MWANIWEILKSLVSINDRLSRLEKQSENLFGISIRERG